MASVLASLSPRSGEVPDLARIDDGERQGGSGAGRRDRGFEAAGGFQHDQ